MLRSLPVLLIAGTISAQTIDWKKVEEEALRHFTAIIQIDTQNPPGNETKATEYLRKVLEAEGIATKTFELEPGRGNLVARLKGSGAKRPLMIMAHTDVVLVDPKKWVHPPFSAHRESGYIYGRGTVDDKDNVTAALMTALLMKRNNVALDRDVIFFFEAGEEASTKAGIEFMVEKHWPEIEAEICLAEGGGVRRRNGAPQYATVQTAEKIPYRIELTARGPAGHGSVPLENNAVAKLSAAVARVAAWMPPMRMNDTTRTYFERLAGLAGPEERARYNALLDPARSAAAQRELFQKEPMHSSMLRTSVSPNMMQAGYQINVIPSEAKASLDVRALPDEDMPAFLDLVRKVVNDPAVEVAFGRRDSRPKAPVTDSRAEAFRVLEEMTRRHYNVPALPYMSTGATDMAYLRAKGVACYGIGPMIDVEDGPKGFGAHSDQERILEEALYRFVRFNYDAAVKIAGQ